MQCFSVELQKDWNWDRRQTSIKDIIKANNRAFSREYTTLNVYEDRKEVEKKGNGKKGKDKGKSYPGKDSNFHRNEV